MDSRKQRISPKGPGNVSDKPGTAPNGRAETPTEVGGVTRSGEMRTQPPPLATLHGFSTSPQLFDETGLVVSHPLWLPGHGPNPDLGATSFDDAVERLAQKLRELPDPPHLLAYSMGARLALWVTLRFPELLHSVTLIAPHPGLKTRAEREERADWEQGWIDLLHSGGIEAFEERWSRLPLFASQTSLQPEVLERQRRARLRHSPGGLALALRACGLARMTSAWDALKRLQVPVQWLVGGNDQKFVLLSEHACQANSSLRRTVVPGAGHNLCLEAPSRVRALVLQSLQSPGSIEPRASHPEDS